jgi:dienelactone hydrolase
MDEKIETGPIPYQDNECSLEAFVAVPSKQKRPLVILCHSWRGKDDFICEKAKEISQWGYVGFALDMYGKGIIGKSKEENALLKKPFIEDRQLLQRRVVKASVTK